MTKFFKAALLLMVLFAASTIKADEFRIERFTIAAGGYTFRKKRMAIWSVTSIVT